MLLSQSGSDLACLLGKHFPAELQIEKELVNLCDCATRFVFKMDCAARFIFKMIDYILWCWKVGFSDSKNKGLYINIYMLYQDGIL